ncbi:MAG: hypothetical protein V3V64_09825, partial [Acidiferrobacterales bacterium]
AEAQRHRGFKVKNRQCRALFAPWRFRVDCFVLIIAPRFPDHLFSAPSISVAGVAYPATMY